MTKKLPMLLTLAALVGFAAPTLAAESHGAKHDPQAVTSTAKPKAAPAKESKSAPAKGRHAKASKSKAAAKTPAPQTVAPPASK